MKEKKNIKFFDRELLAKYLCNEVSSLEKLEVETWLGLSDENQEELEQSRKMLDAVNAYYKAKDFDSVTAWEKVKANIKPAETKVINYNKMRKEVLSRFYKYAAVILFALLLGTAGYYIGFKNREVYSEIISTPTQVINEYILPDGSVVALNSNSKLVYPKHFKGDTREVTIDGEAFFEVKPNPEKPFIIKAGDAQIKVVGTSFNVSAYPENETVEVIVKTGKVQVTSKNNDSVQEISEVLLTPGEKGTLYNSSKILEKTENSNPNYLAWKTHDFVFTDVPLNEVFKCLEKTYHVKVEVSSPDLNNLILNAQFDHKTIDFIMNVVKLTFNLELTVNNELYTFSEHKNN